MYTSGKEDPPQFDWDAVNRRHVSRHRVSPPEAEQALVNDPFDLKYEVVDGEERWTVIGHSSELRVLIVVWTLRAEERISCDHRAGRQQDCAGYLPPRKGVPYMKKLIVPKFATEAEEARWWDRRLGVVEENLVEAITTGRAGRGGPQRVIQERRESKNITIRMAVAEIERARKLAVKKGIGYQTYIKILLREALDRESKRAR